MNEDSRRYMIVIVATEAATLSSALVHIKKGRTDRGMELLEQGLDRCVMCLGHMRKEAEAADLRNLTNALTVVRSYRRHYPRHSATDQGGVVSTEIRDLQDTAQKILEEI